MDTVAGFEEQARMKRMIKQNIETCKKGQVRNRPQYVGSTPILVEAVGV